MTDIVITRPIFANLKRCIIEAVDEFNDAINEQRIVAGAAEANVWVIQSCVVSDENVGVRVQFNETAGTVLTTPARHNVGGAQPERQESLIGTYDLIVGEENVFTWRAASGYISSEVLVEHILGPLFGSIGNAKM